MKINEKYSEIFDFRLATVGDLDDIMLFIRRFWKENHILGNDREFFLYEHGGTKDTINFFLAIEKLTGNIRSILGFIPYSNEAKRLHVCGVISQTHPDNNVPLLGLETMKRMLYFLQPISYCGIGTNPKTMLPLVKKFLKRHVGIMSHYYMLNKTIKDFKVAKPDLSEKCFNSLNEAKSNILKYEKVEKFSELVDDLSAIKREKNLPYKSSNYIEHRYFNNPIYKYQIFKIYDVKKSPCAIIFAREVFFNAAYILHWVDYIGEVKSIQKLSSFFQKIMDQKNYEYIDCLCDGIDEMVFNKIGFVKKNHDGKTIIPTYFEPFVLQNIKTHFEKSNCSQIIFKGDADADRPSRRSCAK